MVAVRAIGPIRPFLLVAVGLSCESFAIAQTYSIGYRHNPPYVIADLRGRPGGLAFDVVDKAASRRGIRLDWRFTHQLGSQMIEQGAADLWPLADPRDFGQGTFVTRPWLSDSIYLIQLDSVVQQGKPIKRLAVNRTPRAMELAQQVYPAAQLVTAPGGPEAMERVCRGEADALFINSRVAERLLLSRPPSCHGVAFARDVVRGVNLPLGIGSRPASRHVAEALRDEIEAMSRDGTLGELFSQWAVLANSDVEQKNLVLRVERNLSRYRLAAYLSLVLLILATAAAFQFRRAQRLAHQAVEAKSRFVATVSHELRTPLNGFLSLSDLLLKTPLTGDQRELAEAIRASSHSFSRIVEDVLDFARVSQGKLQLELTPTYAPNLVDDVVRLLTGRAAERGLYLRAAVSPGFPWLLADHVRLRQILLNLADNAIKFTSQGGVIIAARVEAGPSAEDVPVVFEVADTGVGIAPSHLPRLFAAFQQADQTNTRRFGGLGLGLAVCRDLVKAMQGDIKVDSQLGVGTTMRVRLTLRRTPPPPEPEPAASSALPQQLPVLRVLVVDDNRTNLHVAKRLLEKLGHQVEQASGGAEAVERVAASQRGEGPPLDLVLMDCQMPEIDGFEATRRIRAQEPAGSRLPIFALTASVQQSDQEECLRAGMDHFLAKPISLQQLSDALNRLKRLQ